MTLLGKLEFSTRLIDAMFKVYGFSKVNSIAYGHTRDLRVLWALEEVGLPYSIVGMDHPAGELNTSSYRQCSPFEQVPALDDDGLILSESAAIVLYLSRKSGKLMPSDSEGEAQVLRWCFAAMNTVELPLMALVINDWNSDDRGSKHRKFLLSWIERALGNLAKWMEGRNYIATDEFTAADLLMANVLSASVSDESLITPYPELMSYRSRCLGRPAWNRVIDAYRTRVVVSKP
ncbi:MAG: glutathione S-transferase family protein [Polaromonas sp.]|nr:glutathione S-transferase family protein [Polaromonas sp.]